MINKFVVVCLLFAIILSSCYANTKNVYNQVVDKRSVDSKAETMDPATEPMATVMTDKDDFFDDLEFAILKANDYDNFYSYENMLEDIAYMQKCYTKLQVIKLCETADGRDVCDVIVGDQQSPNQILVMGAMHAREYITTPLIIEQLRRYICDNFGNESHDQYKGIDIHELCKEVTVHFVPMVNPDGVSISQMGLEGIQNKEIKNKILQMGSCDFSQWKANAEGVDLNRNFDAGWEEYIGSAKPSSERYKGEYPGCTSETEALIKLTQDYKFKRTISYHTCGALIYWYYKQTGNVLEETQRFAQELA